jgi:hypothetical protein
MIKSYGKITKKKKQKKEDGPGVYDICVDGKYVDKLCANNEVAAVEKYKRAHPEVVGVVTVKRICGSPIQIDCDEYVKRLKEIEQNQAEAIRVHYESFEK